MITVICGTNRENSNSAIISRVYEDIIQQFNVEVNVLYLKDLPNNFAYDEMNEKKSEAFEAIVDKYVVKANKFIFVIPEYNGGFPGVLKSFLDVVAPKYFNNKKAALVGVASGHAGALRPLDHLTNVLHYLKVEVMSDKPKFSSINALLDDNKLNDQQAIDRLKNQVEKFLKF